jgi:alpha/beta superfamily hydrolase
MITSHPQSKFKTLAINYTTDGLRLSGTLHLPGTDRPPIVIGCHGLMSDSNSPKQIALALQCNRQGMAYLRFDHRGCGASEGDFNAVTSLESRCNDLIAAVELVRKRPDIGNSVGFFGSSFGGTVCLAVAAKMEIATLVTFAAPFRSDFIRTTAHSASVNQTVSQLDPHQLRFDLTPALQRIQSIHVFHGQNDEVVPVQHAHAIYTAAKPPKRLTLQIGGDHRMSDVSFQTAFIRQAADWLKAGLHGKTSLDSTLERGYRYDKETDPR